jgi:hypothetical protein
MTIEVVDFRWSAYGNSIAGGAGRYEVSLCAAPVYGYGFELPPTGAAMSSQYFSGLVGTTLNLFGIIGAYKIGDKVKITGWDMGNYGTLATGAYILGTITNLYRTHSTDEGVGVLVEETFANGYTGIYPVYLNIAGQTGADGGFRNVIINGAMQIAQRSTSVSSITSGETYRTVDRFVSAFGTTGTWTETQSTDAPPGFGNSRKFQCTTANASLSAGSYLIWGQNIEGQNLQQFAKGTSSAKPFTLSFWVKAFQTGTFVAELYDNTNSRQVTKTFTINTSATWEYKTIQFPADATGAFANSNANALSLYFWLVAGTTFTSGTSGSWSTASNANRAVGLTVNGASSTSNYFQFTGVQLEQNYQPTPFEQRPIGVELALCQRYYFRIGGDSGYQRLGWGVFSGSTSARCETINPVTMRSVASSIESSTIALYDQSTILPVTAFTLSSAGSGKNLTQFDATIASGGTTYRPLDIVSNNSTSAYIGVSAEL